MTFDRPIQDPFVAVMARVAALMVVKLTNAYNLWMAILSMAPNSRKLASISSSVMSWGRPPEKISTWWIITCQQKDGDLGEVAIHHFLDALRNQSSICYFAMEVDFFYHDAWMALLWPLLDDSKGSLEMEISFLVHPCSVILCILLQYFWGWSSFG